MSQQARTFTHTSSHTHTKAIPVTDAGFAILALRSRKSLPVALLLGYNLFRLTVCLGQCKYLPPTIGVFGCDRALFVEKCPRLFSANQVSSGKNPSPNMKKKKLERIFVKKKQDSQKGNRSNYFGKCSVYWTIDQGKRLQRWRCWSRKQVFIQPRTQCTNSVWNHMWNKQCNWYHDKSNAWQKSGRISRRCHLE